MKNRKKIFKAIRRTVAFFAVFIAVVVGGTLLLVTHNFAEAYVDYETTNKEITDYGKTFVSAHRSGGGIFPENTMMAFEGCINSDSFRTDIFEFDLHITKDDELIILHDSTLDRTTDAEEVFGREGNRPEDYSYEEILKLNFGDAFKTDEGETPYKDLEGEAVPDSLRVSRLRDVFSYLQSNGDFGYIIEIKNSGELGCRSADILYSTLKEFGLLDKAIIGTFNPEVTAYMDEAYPDMKRSASIPEVVQLYFNSLLGFDKDEDAYKFDALQIPAGLSFLRLDTTRLVNYAHRHNIAVQYWTINDVEEMAHLKEIGADCIMSDIPDVAYEILNS